LLKIGIVPVAVVALVAAVIFFFVPLIEEKEPYYKDEPLSYREIDSYAIAHSGSEVPPVGMPSGPYVEGFILIENTDTVPGVFTVNFIFTTPNITFADNDSARIVPGEVKTLKGVTAIDMGEDWEWSLNITPDTKSVAYQKKVTLFEYVTDS
jgi:hypothetical protein|tara:strand:+ start:102 stop:557 length:456 start_codon:yes stop_codon:yes gene_type:complete